MITIQFDHAADIVVSKKFNNKIQYLLKDQDRVNVGHYKFLYVPLCTCHVFIGDIQIIKHNTLICNKQDKKKILSSLYRYKREDN
jgi:hypothetical protein